MSMFSKGLTEICIRIYSRAIAKAEMKQARIEDEQKYCRDRMVRNEASDSQIAFVMVSYVAQIKQLDVQIEKFESKLGIKQAEYTKKQA